MALTAKARKRLLIAMVVVVGLVGVWWLKRLQIDPRFIGTWKLQNVLPGSIYDFTELEFRSDGTCLTRGGFVPSPRKWSVSDSQLIFEPPRSEMGSPIDAVVRVSDRLRPPKSRSYAVIYDAQFPEQSELVLRRRGGSATWHRVRQ
jgi:hypothetical protein